MFAEEAKYSRRNIESNWSKYELPPSDEEVILWTSKSYFMWLLLFIVLSAVPILPVLFYFCLLVLLDYGLLTTLCAGRGRYHDRS